VLRGIKVRGRSNQKIFSMSHSSHSDSEFTWLVGGSDDSDSAAICLASRSESDDSFEAKLIAARGIRYRSTSSQDLQSCDQTAKCSSPPAIPAPKIWRRNSSKKQQQGTVPCGPFKPELLKQQLEMTSEQQQIAAPCFDVEPAAIDEWAKSFFSLVGLNEA
jgi:hypothetical protein